MAYSIQFRQTCSICFDETKPVLTRRESIAPDPVKPLLANGERQFQCGHAFHAQCINRYLFDGNKSCPLCRTEFTPEERKFELSEDPVPPAGRKCIYEDSDKNAFMTFTERTPEKVKQFVMKHRHKFHDPRYADILMHGGKLDIDNAERLIAQEEARIPPVFFADQSGISHHHL